MHKLNQKVPKTLSKKKNKRAGDIMTRNIPYKIPAVRQVDNSTSNYAVCCCPFKQPPRGYAASDPERERTVRRVVDISVVFDGENSSVHFLNNYEYKTFQRHFLR